MKNILAYIVIIMFAFQSLPQIVQHTIELVSIEKDLDSKGSQKNFQKETEKDFTDIAYAWLDFTNSMRVFTLHTAEKIIITARDVVVPPPDFC